jgi:hypothetical protein
MPDSGGLRETGTDGARAPIAPIRPREFCALERQIVRTMAMRKKRNLAMRPIQELKVQLLDYLEAADPEPEAFRAAVAEAVLEVSGGIATGPAQAVASDLLMDWNMACSSPAFVEWLHRTANTVDLSDPIPEPRSDSV